MKRSLCQDSNRDSICRRYHLSDVISGSINFISCVSDISLTIAYHYENLPFAIVFAHPSILWFECYDFSIIICSWPVYEGNMIAIKIFQPDSKLVLYIACVFCESYISSFYHIWLHNIFIMYKLRANQQWYFLIFTASWHWWFSRFVEFDLINQI